MNVLDALFADPPQVHGIWDETGTRVGTGLFPTDRDCYELLVSRCSAGSATLETGLGLSTALFAALGARHTCVTWGAEEAERLTAYLKSKDISAGAVTFEIGPSNDVLPRLEPSPLDIVFIDGGHAFPTPMIDWYYAASRLKAGGLLVVDDLQLPAPAILGRYLAADPRWRKVEVNAKWGAYDRLESGSLLEEWWAQPFFTDETPHRGTGIVRALRQRLARLR